MSKRRKEEIIRLTRKRIDGEISQSELESRLQRLFSNQQELVFEEEQDAGEKDCSRVQ